MKHEKEELAGKKDVEQLENVQGGIHNNTGEPIEVPPSFQPQRPADGFLFLGGEQPA